MYLGDRQHGVAAFAFAEEQVFAEEKVGRGDRAGDVGGLHVVHVDASALDVFAGLAF